MPSYCPPAEGWARLLLTHIAAFGWRRPRKSGEMGARDSIRSQLCQGHGEGMGPSV